MQRFDLQIVSSAIVLKGSLILIAQATRKENGKYEFILCSLEGQKIERRRSGLVLTHSLNNCIIIWLSGHVSVCMCSYALSWLSNTFPAVCLLPRPSLLLCCCCTLRRLSFSFPLSSYPVLKAWAIFVWKTRCCFHATRKGIEEAIVNWDRSTFFQKMWTANCGHLFSKFRRLAILLSQLMIPVYFFPQEKRKNDVEIRSSDSNVFSSWRC